MEVLGCDRLDGATYLGELGNPNERCCSLFRHVVPVHKVLFRRGRGWDVGKLGLSFVTDFNTSDFETCQLTEWS